MSEVIPPQHDIGMRLPLSGIHLIEASAGTGKTFTLMTLVLRLLLERGIALPDILTVTFTHAATQELRERLRRRLRLAERLSNANAPLKNDGEERVTMAVLMSARVAVGEQVVRLRLAAALLQLDEAAVSTIHEFCHRALRELSFRAGTLFDGEVIDDASEIWQEVAADVWRQTMTGVDAPLRNMLATAWKTPSALAPDLQALCDSARTHYPAADESDNAAALHRLRETAAARFQTALVTRGLRTQDQLIEYVWRASADAVFVRALSRRWPVVLVDEFQDTDPRQWDIFRRMFEAGQDAGADSAALILIGDPKQAIYRFRGGDLATYLAARHYAELDGSVVTLDTNFRSRPAVLQAIATLFHAHPLPFVEADIAFHAVAAAGPAQDDDLRIDGRVPPGLTLHWLPQAQGKSDLRLKDDEFEMMRDAAVAAIVELLAQGRLRIDGSERALHPQDIAVLTQTNAQAREMQVALARAGVGAATLSNADVFASETAAELHLLLESLAMPADPARFRAALATRLVGSNSAAIAALEQQEDAYRALTSRFEHAADLWRRRGPLPALLPFFSEAAVRWLGERDGSRRLTDGLHLAELLQAQSMHRHGVADQLTWYSKTHVSALQNANQSEERALRLESDADLVQIATLHKSKGLEYPVVVLPFVAYRGDRSHRGMRYDDFHAADKLARAWRHKELLMPTHSVEIDAQIERDEMAEAMRQLYVGLTRAQYALHVVWSRNKTTDCTAMHRLLHDTARTGRKQDALDHEGMRTRIEQLANSSANSVAVKLFDPTQRPKQLADPQKNHDAHLARTARRVLRSAPWLHSFSSLQGSASHSNEPAFMRGADDEKKALDDDDASPLGGTSFGNVVHDILEHADFAAWNRAQSTAPEHQAQLVERALLHHGLIADTKSIAQTTRLVARALNARLPGGVQLCTLPPTQRVSELEFHFHLSPTRIEALHALLIEYGYPRIGQLVSSVSIEGLMHGYIDLVYRDQAGLYYVVDYKTNRLPAYDAAALRRAVAAHDYDLQYLIYLVALQRWLRFRRGDAFDPKRHLGGAVYLFLRGLDGQEHQSHQTLDGMHHDRPPQALLDALDALFDGRGA